MAKVKNKPTQDDKKNSKLIRRTQYVFKDPSELPPSKPDYVVMSPTPLGLRPVPKSNKKG